MKNYIVYTTATGVIVRTGQCRNDLFKLQAASGQSVLEGSAASDGSKMIVDGSVVDTPGWTPPEAPATPEISSVDLTDITNQIADIVQVERLSSPVPSTVRVTFSGIENCGSNATGNSTAESFNGTWDIPSSGGTTYELTSGDKIIQIGIGQSGAYARCFVYVSPDTWIAFNATISSLRRGETVSNKVSCSSSYDSEGHNGTCFVH